ncbi:MAG: 30S ribosomal protein S14 [Gammaproteobacteria bacterium]
MPRKSLLEREKKRKKLYDKYAPKREALLEERKAAMVEGDIDAVLEIQAKLQKLPRNAASSRRQNRCQFNNRPRGVYKFAKACRHVIIKLVERGEASGVRWSSW